MSLKASISFEYHLSGIQFIISEWEKDRDSLDEEDRRYLLDLSNRLDGFSDRVRQLGYKFSQ